MRGTLVALAFTAWLLPSIGGASGGLCFAGDGAPMPGCCCTPDPSGHCSCCCCRDGGSQKNTTPRKNAPTPRRQEGCARVDLADHPTNRPENPTPRVPVAFESAAFVAQSDCVSTRVDVAVARPRAAVDPPPRGSYGRPFVLRV